MPIPEPVPYPPIDPPFDPLEPPDGEWDEPPKQWTAGPMIGVWYEARWRLGGGGIPIVKTVRVTTSPDG